MIIGNSSIAVLARASLLSASVILAMSTASSVGALELAQLSTGAQSVAPAPAGTIVLERLRFGSPGLTYVISRLEVSGTSMSRTELAAVFDVKSTEPLPLRFARLNFALATMPEFVTETKLGTETSRTVYRDVRFESVVAGKVARVTASGGTAESRRTKPRANVTKGVFGAYALNELDIPLMARIFMGTGTDGVADIRPMMGASSVADYRMESTEPPFSMAIKRIASDGFSGRPGKIGFREAFETLSTTNKFDDLDDEEKRRFFASYVEILDNFSVGATELTSITGRFKDGNGGEPTFGIAAIRFAQPDAQMRFEGFEVTGLRSSEPDRPRGRRNDPQRAEVQPTGSMRIGSYEVKDFSFSTTMAAVRALIAQPDIDTDAIDFRAFVPVLGTVRVRDMVIDVPVEGSRSERLKISVGENEVTFGLQIKGVPTAVSYTIRNLVGTLPAETKDQTVALMRSMGFEKVDLSARVAGKWNEATQDFAVEEITVEGVDLGTVRISGVLGNVPRKLFEADAESLPLLAMAATAKSLDIRVQNRGIVDVITRSMASQSGQPVDQVRNQLAISAGAGARLVLGDSEQTRKLGEALEQFLRGGRDLDVTLTARQPQGLSIPELLTASSPAEVLAKADLSVTSR